ncbi:MAG: tetratricopeptide repeat protein [Methanobrevibacter sp.]|jgi:superkiller protein 3|nr:tetratricopeptide repeat protein [Methanobrevibacter sp.]
MSNKIKKKIKRLDNIIASCDDKKILNEVDKLLKDYPNNLYLIKVKSISLFRLEKYEELLKFHDSYLEDIYTDSDIVHTKMDALNALNDIKEMAIFVNKSLIYHLDDYYLIETNIDILNDFQSDADDMKFLKGLLKVNPNNRDAYLNLAYISNNFARYFDDPSMYQDAVNYFDKAIELSKLINYTQSHIYISKGQSLIKLKKYDEALKTIDLIDDGKHNVVVKFREKAIIHRELGDYETALKYVDKAIENDSFPLDNSLMEIKGTIYLCMKDYDLAIEYFNQAIDKHRHSYYYKAVALKEKGEYLESLNCLNMIEENEYLIKQGWINYQYEKAQKLIKEINDLNN